MNRESKFFLFSYFLVSMGHPGQFIFAIKKADPITGTIMVSLYFISIAIASICFSKLSDAYMKRKIFALLGFTIFSIVFILYYFSTLPLHLILCSSLIGVGFAAYTPTSNALFSEMEPTIPSGKLMSYFFVVASAGWAVGSILGGVVNQYFGDSVFFFTAIMTIIGGCLYFFKVHDVPYERLEREASQNAADLKNTQNLKLYSFLIAILSIAVLTRHMCAQGGFALLPNYLEEGLTATPLILSLVLAINMSTQAILMLPVGWLVDHKKFGRKIVLLLGIIGSNIAVFSWSFISIPWILVFPQVLMGFAWPAVATASTAIITDTTTRKNRSQGMGWFNAGLAIGGSIGPLIGALIFINSGGSFASAFQILSIFPIIGIILVLVSFSEDRTTHQYYLFRRKNRSTSQ
jgi:MFS family permease